MTRVTDSAAPPHERLSVIAHEAQAAGRRITPPETGRLLHVLAWSCGAARILEVGTGSGYATLWLAAALPADGMMITMERDADRIEQARGHLAAAGLAGRVSVMSGDATRFLHKVAGPFDLVFQDSGPASCDTMHDRLVTLLSPGGVLVADNIPQGDDRAAAYRRRLADDPRLFTAFLPLGDGVSISVKRAS